MWGSECLGLDLRLGALLFLFYFFFGNDIGYPQGPRKDGFTGTDGHARR